MLCDLLSLLMHAEKICYYESRHKTTFKLKFNNLSITKINIMAILIHMININIIWGNIYAAVVTGDLD